LNYNISHTICRNAEANRGCDSFRFPLPLNLPLTKSYTIIKIIFYPGKPPSVVQNLRKKITKLVW